MESRNTNSADLNAKKWVLFAYLVLAAVGGWAMHQGHTIIDGITAIAMGLLAPYGLFLVYKSFRNRRQ